MDLFLAKISLFFSLVLSAFLVPGYIGLSVAELSFDFKTGDTAPVYFLAVANIGPQKARFDVTSDDNWVSAYREGQLGATSVEISQTGAVNFIVTLHPQGLTDGSHQTKIRVKAVNPLGFGELESKEIVVTLNKNLTVLPTISPTATVTPSVEQSPLISITVVTPEPTGAELTTRPSPSLTPRRIPVTTLPIFKPNQIFPSTPQPELSLPAPTKGIPRSFWLFLKNLFF